MTEEYPNCPLSSVGNIPSVKQDGRELYSPLAVNIALRRCRDVLYPISCQIHINTADPPHSTKLTAVSRLSPFLSIIISRVNSNPTNLYHRQCAYYARRAAK